MMLPPTPQATETDQLVVALVSVSLTLIIGVVVGLVTALLARKGEHSKWLRERRYEAYVAFMIDMETLNSLIQTKPSLENLIKTKARIEAYVKKASAASEAVSLLGPRKVNAAGQKWAWAANAYANNKAEAEKAAFSAARWQFLIVAGKVLNSRNVTPVPMRKPVVGTSGAVVPVPS